MAIFRRLLVIDLFALSRSLGIEVKRLAVLTESMPVARYHRIRSVLNEDQGLRGNE